MKHTASGTIQTVPGGNGVPELLVNLFLARNPDRESEWIRKATTISRDNGSFHLEYDFPEEREAPPTTLVLEVATPEKGHGDEDGAKRITVIHRRDSSRSEAFLIRLKESDLLAVGLTPPGTIRDAEEQIRGQRDDSERRALFEEESKKRFRDSLKRSTALNAEVETKLGAFLSGLSQVSDTEKAGFIPDKR